MSLSEKIGAVKQFVDGTRNVTDLGFFWQRPRAWVGGEMLNRAGYQPLRAVYQNFAHRPTLAGLPDELLDKGRALLEDGVVTIENFLPDEVFAQVRAEYLSALDPQQNPVKQQTANGVRSSTGIFEAERHPATAQYVVNDQRMWSLVSAGLGRRLKYRPGAYFHTETKASPDVEDTDHNVVSHEDVYYPTFKAFFLMNRNDAANGSFVTVPKSHRLDLKRLKHEYLYSIDMARQKQGKSVSFPVHKNGRMEVYGRVYSKEELREVQITGDANTLIIANTMGFHRRGGSAVGKDREQLRLSFRCAETLHHRLYPRFGTQSSRRLKEAKYY